MDKKLIREKNLLLRKSLNQKEASDVIVSKILVLDAFLSCENVLIFYTLKNEINLLPLLFQKNKNFFLPRVDGDNLLICPYDENKLQKGAFGIMEPVTNPVNPSVIDIAFIPCLAIDKNLNRVGYGKGFYDRLFSNPDFRAKKIAVINKELTVDIIDSCPFDKKADFVITD